MHTQNRVVQASRGRRVPRQQVAAARTNRRVGSRWRAAAVAMSLGCAAASAHAESFFQIEAGIGASHYTQAADGLWWQQGMSHNLHLSAPAWRVGVQLNAIDYQPGSWVPGVAFHALYLNFGPVGMQSMAAPDYDPNVFNKTNGGYYDDKAHECVKECGPLRDFTSSGRMQAFALTVEPYWKRGKWRFGVEAGPMLYRATWDASAVSLTDTPWKGPAGSVETFHRNASWQVGALVGASVGYGPVTVRYSYAYAKSAGTLSGSNTVPAGFKGAHMLTLGYTF